MNQYRLNLHLPLIGSVFVMFVITIFSFFYFQDAAIHENKKNIAGKFFDDLELRSQYDTKIFSTIIDMVDSDKSIIKSFESGDKKELFESIKPLYDKLNKNIDLTHFYFILNDGTVFLRVHNYSADGDVVKRTTFLNSQQTNSLSSGLEFGLMKNYTLRVVKPWIVNGRRIGYIELGKEIDKTIGHYSELLNTHIYMAVKKDAYKNAPEDVKNSLNSRTATKNHYIAYGTTVVPENIESILDGKLNNSEIDLNGSKYFVATEPLVDISKKNLGYFIFLSDMSDEHLLMHKSIKILIIFLMLPISIMLFIGVALIKRRESTIYNLTGQLNEKNKKLQKLFDVQRNITIISNGKKTLLLNKAALSFFNVDNIDEFRKYNEDISERFISSDGYFSLEKVSKSDNWIEAIEPLLGDARVVTMQDAEGVPHAFNISVGQFEEQQYLVSFADISATMIEKINLSKKIEKDELTDTFNRKFFNKNIASIINGLASDTYLGVVMVDIDFFKRVNDTHGHNVGDIVLKQFSQYVKSSIRLDDFLIRWGGEEFIVLIKTKSNEALYRTAEHIRQRIENSKFDTVGNITCSLGITLYVPGEDMVEAVERADTALYTSKEGGRNMVSQLENIDANKFEPPINKKYLRAVLDENAIMVDFECNMLDNFSYLPEEIIGKSWFDMFVAAPDMKETLDYFREIISSEDGKVYMHTNDIICKDKTHRLLDFENTVFIKDEKKFVSFVAKEHFSDNY